MFDWRPSQSRSRSRCLTKAALISSRGAALRFSRCEHLLLRDQHLVEVAFHEDDLVGLVSGRSRRSWETIFTTLPREVGSQDLSSLSFLTCSNS